MWPEVRQWLTRHRGRLWGSGVGLVVSLMVMRFGVIWTVFICAAVLVGYLVGRHLDDEQENLSEVLERLLPPGRR
jgi:uncharacterized membrane protein